MSLPPHPDGLTWRTISGGPFDNLDFCAMLDGMCERWGGWPSDLLEDEFRCAFNATVYVNAARWHEMRHGKDGSGPRSREDRARDRVEQPKAFEEMRAKLDRVRGIARDGTGS